MVYDRVNHAAVVTVTGGGAITLGNRYELGIARVKVTPGVSSDTFYAHNDHLGTLRAESDVWAAFNTYPVHTAFGEDMTNLGQRHSYAGAFGYQSNPNFTALHVGARYYDPSSGRFLQRDPIGIFGGLNVYAYASSGPTTRIDPEGLCPGGNDQCPACIEAGCYSRGGNPSQSQQDMRNERRNERYKALASGAAILACALIPGAGQIAAGIAAIVIFIYEGVADANDEAAGN